MGMSTTSFVYEMKWSIRMTFSVSRYYARDSRWSGLEMLQKFVDLFRKTESSLESMVNRRCLSRC